MPFTLPKWGIDLAIVFGLAALLGYVHHIVYKKGWDDATAKVEAAATVRQHTLQLKIDTAEHAHDQELVDLRKFRDDYPIGPVRLCLGPRVPVETAHGGPIAGRTGTGAAGVQPLPAGDPDGGAGNAGPDIAGLLDALAASADAVNNDRTTLIAIVEPLTK